MTRWWVLTPSRSLLHTTPVPKTTHESQRLVGGLLSHPQHHQRVIMTRWWVSTSSRTRRRSQKPPTSHDNSGVDFHSIPNTTNSLLLHPAHNATVDTGPKNLNHPRVTTTRGWACLTPPTSHCDSWCFFFSFRI